MPASSPQRAMEPADSTAEERLRRAAAIAAEFARLAAWQDELREGHIAPPDQPPADS